MKSLRLLAHALLFGAAVLSVSVAFAGSEGTCSAHAKATTTAKSAATGHEGCRVDATHASGSGCTREMAAACTPEMREACARNPEVAAAMGCNPHGATTTAAHGGKVTARTASAKAANSMVCKAHQTAVAHECDACEEWLESDAETRAIGGKVQVVSLKNGAMIVYTVERATDVRALQTAVAKRNEKLNTMLSDASDAKLCEDCRQLRGAMASGKLHREFVNVERGCMTLITSEDRDVVQRIRNMTSQSVAVR